MISVSPIRGFNKSQDYWGDSVRYIKQLSSRVINASKFQFTGGIQSGSFSYSPGDGYNNEVYLRDFAMACRSYSEFFTINDINVVLSVFNSTKGGSGQIFDAVVQSGGAHPAGGMSTASIDNQYEFVDLIYQHYQRTGTTTAYSTYKSTILTALAYPNIENNLVKILSEAPWPKVGFGFQDVVASEGYEVMTSVMRYRSLKQLVIMATAAGDSSDAATWQSQADAVPASLETQLWDASRGLFKNASVKNVQHSIPGSAYAVVQGCCSNEVADIISQKLIDMMPGHVDALAGKGCFLSGYVRHLPLDENWDTLRAGYSLGTYQNGAYWATFTGWVALAIKRVSQYYSNLVYVDLIEKLTTDSVSIAPLEAFNTSPAYQGATRYTVSSTLPLEYFS